MSEYGTAPTLTTRASEVVAEVNNFYDRTLLEKAVPAFLYNRFAQVRDIPANSGTNVIKFRKYGLLAANTTPLTEGVTPAGKALAVTDITATVLRYGDYVTLTDKVVTETYDPILTETADILGEQAGDTIDQLCRDIVCATSTKQYAGAATQTTEVDTDMLLDRDEIKEAVRTLKNANAKPMTSMIDASTGFNTQPLNRCFIGIVHPNTAFDLDDASGWIPVQNYPNKGDVMENEIGSCAGVRFLESTNAKVRASGGANGINVYSTLIIAQNAYAQTRISGQTLKNIVKPLGSAGTADPLDQRTTSGWKLSYVAKVLDDTKLVDIQHAVSA